MLTWDSVPTRFYYVQETTNLGTNNWLIDNIGLVSSQGQSTTVSLAVPASAVRFYRIQAVRPLTP